MGNFAPEKLGRTRGELQKMPFSATQSEHLRIVQNRVPLEENDKLLWLCTEKLWIALKH